MIYHLLLKKTGLANLKSHVDKLDINKLKNLPTNVSIWKSKIDKLDVEKKNTIEKKITDHNHDKYITTPEFNKLAT